MIHLRHCTVEWTADGCTTRFPDGTEVSAWPHWDQPHYHVVSHRCGYGDDLVAYCREHELAHSVVAEFFTDSPSDVLWCLAHNRQPEPYGAVAEELMAQTLQRFVRANERPIIADVEWDRLRAKALKVFGEAGV